MTSIDVLVETITEELRGGFAGLTVAADPASGDPPALRLATGRAIPLRDLLRVELRNRPGIAREIVLTLTDGSRLQGGIGPNCDESNVEISGGLFPRGVRVPLEWIRRIDFLRTSAAAASSTPAVAGALRVLPELPPIEAADDAVILSSGGLLTGIVERIDAKEAVLDDKKLGSVATPWEKIATVLISAIGAQPAAPQGTTQVTATGTEGSMLHGELLGIEGERVRVRSPLIGEQEFPLREIATLEFHFGRVAYLAERQPLAVVEGNPYVSATVFERFFRWQRDRNASGGALVIGGRAFRHGIGVWSESRIAFAVEPHDRVFQSWIGIDSAARPPNDEPEFASVVFKVAVDGVVKFDSGVVNWQAQARRVEVPIAGASKLELIVEMGEGFHILDQADWGDARVVRDR